MGSKEKASLRTIQNRSRIESNPAEPNSPSRRRLTQKHDNRPTARLLSVGSGTRILRALAWFLGFVVRLTVWGFLLETITFRGSRA